MQHKAAVAAARLDEYKEYHASPAVLSEEHMQHHKEEVAAARLDEYKEYHASPAVLSEDAT